MVKDLNDLLAVYHLLDITFSLTYSLLLLNKVLGRSAADELCKVEHQEYTCDEYKRHPNAVVEHKSKYADYDGSASKERRECLRYELS